MGDQSIESPAAPTTLHYATPVQRLRRRVRGTPAILAGMFLVLVAALTLIIGFIVTAEYRNSMPNDFEIALAFAVCIFSAVCLFAGLPLIYRGTRADD